jgi:hypothetical protein
MMLSDDAYLSHSLARELGKSGNRSLAGRGCGDMRAVLDGDAN